jgi:hypothetical protein
MMMAVTQMKNVYSCSTGRATVMKTKTIRTKQERFHRRPNDRQSQERKAKQILVGPVVRELATLTF